MCDRSDGQPRSSELREAQRVARLVQLCVRQIGDAMDEATTEIAALSVSVLEAARQANALSSSTDRGERRPQTRSSTGSGDPERLQRLAMDASSKLQFADRLHQRLSNVSGNLTALAELLTSIGGPITDQRWSEFLHAARHRFTMEQERVTFDVAFGADMDSGPRKEPVSTDGSVIFGATRTRDL